MLLSYELLSNNKVKVRLSQLKLKEIRNNII